VLGVLFCGWLFSSLERIYLEGGLAGGAVFLLGIKGTDISAYLVGRAIGRHRFLAVSPKKTLEGCAAALGWGGLWFALAPQRLAGAGFPWWQGALAGIILSVAAQIGDYSESLLKREYQVKDSSRLLPEFGGALDLIDSLIFPGYLYWWVLQA
jgi:phosphatidate cytidylyltransferase